MDKERVLEIVRFCINGAISFVVDYGCMIILKEVFQVHYLIASGVGFSLSVLVNYYICLLWVFKGGNKGKTNKVLFIGSSVVGLVMNSLLMYGLVEFILINYMVSKVIATIIVMIWNYLMKKKAMNV